MKSIESRVIHALHPEHDLIKEEAAFNFNSAPLLDLTDRERELVRYIAQGKQDKEIATILELSPRTVSNYLQKLYRKKQVNNRIELLKKIQS